MTTGSNRNRSFRSSRIRTPRKTKHWLNNIGGLDISGTANEADTFDLLNAGLVDMGFTKPVGWTVMRVIGDIILAENGNASTPAWAAVAIGLGWISDEIVALAAGSAAIPDPREDGVSEHRWTYTAILQGLEASSAVTSKPAEPDRLSVVRVDSRQMRKQPTLAHEFCLVMNNLNTLEGNTMRLAWNLRILVALP